VLASNLPLQFVAGVVAWFAASGCAPSHLPVLASNFPLQSVIGVMEWFAASGYAPSHLPVLGSNFPLQSETGVIDLVGSVAVCAEPTETKATPNKRINPIKTTVSFFILPSSF
jgi:hypothetical protein